MNNVNAVALRTVGSCLRSSAWPAPSITISCALRPFLAFHHSSTYFVGSVEQRKVLPFFSVRNTIRSRHFSSCRPLQFRSIPQRCALGPLRSQQQTERGLAFSDGPLTVEELEEVFGAVVPPEDLANRLLKVLHGRRVDGTLDLPLPEDLLDLTEEYPHAFDSGLHWLRSNYDVDEDEAIIARIEREESGYDERSPSELRQRAQDLKLYGPQSSRHDETRKEQKEKGPPRYVGPQSGKYQAKLSEKGDVFGESQIEKIREQNEAKAKQEEEELEQQIEEIQARRVAQAKEDRSQALATRPEQSIETAQEEEVRPPNEFEKWILRAKNRATSKLTLESDEIVKRSVASRLLPSFAFVVVFCAGCWFLAENYTTPKRSDRWWPDMSLSFATVTAIGLVNVGIYVLWRFPPAWALLNRYFLVVPATPQPLSLIGNMFSHVQTRHLLFNMLPLLVFGPSLHEDMGRGNFLALYMASGVIGSFASLTHHTVRGILYTTSLGASGGVWAVTAAFFNVHSDNDFTVFFMPDEWKEKLSVKGWMLFSCLIAIDVFNGIRRKVVTVDYVAHAAGALTGWLCAEWFKWKKTQALESGTFVPKTKLPWWQAILQEGGNQDKGES